VATYAERDPASALNIVPGLVPAFTRQGNIVVRLGAPE
jgi:hypothetical protein